MQGELTARMTMLHDVLGEMLSSGQISDEEYRALWKQTTSMQEGETGTVAGSILDPDSPYGEQEDADLLKIDSSSGSGSHQAMQAKQIKKKKKRSPSKSPSKSPPKPTTQKQPGVADALQMLAGLDTDDGEAGLLGALASLGFPEPALSSPQQRMPPLQPQQAPQPPPPPRQPTQTQSLLGQYDQQMEMLQQLESVKEHLLSQMQQTSQPSQAPSAEAVDWQAVGTLRSPVGVPCWTKTTSPTKMASAAPSSAGAPIAAHSEGTNSNIQWHDLTRINHSMKPSPTRTSPPRSSPTRSSPTRSSPTRSPTKQINDGFKPSSMGGNGSSFRGYGYGSTPFALNGTNTTVSGGSAVTPHSMRSSPPSAPPTAAQSRPPSQQQQLQALARAAGMGGAANGIMGGATNGMMEGAPDERVLQLALQHLLDTQGQTRGEGTEERQWWEAEGAAGAQGGDGTINAAVSSLNVSNMLNSTMLNGTSTSTAASGVTLLQRTGSTVGTPRHVTERQLQQAADGRRSAPRSYQCSTLYGGAPPVSTPASTVGYKSHHAPHVQSPRKLKDQLRKQLVAVQKREQVTPAHYFTVHYYTRALLYRLVDVFVFVGIVAAASAGTAAAAAAATI
jgi:hypothetical protein